MSLSDIKSKLYEKEADENLGKHAISEFDAMSAPASESLESAPQKIEPALETWEPKKKGLTDNQKKFLKIGGIGLGAVLLLIGGLVGFYKYKQSSFDESRVQLSIEGLSEVKSGKLIAYEIVYKNANRASLDNATLRITYPENFKPEENPNFKEEGPTSGTFFLGDIKGQAEGKAILNGRTYDANGNLIYLKADISYTPSTFNSPFVTKTQRGITITSTPINFTILAPAKTSSGDSVEYLVSYKNTGQENFDTVRVKVEYPQGFSFAKASPAPSEGENVWYVGNLSAGQEGKISISGKLEGSPEEIKIAKAYIGIIDKNQFLSYAEESTGVKIVPSPLLIRQMVNGKTSTTARAGDTLNYQIIYKNNGATTLKDLIVTEKLDSSVLDFQSLLLDGGGSFSQENKVITWKASDHKELGILEPGQEGQIKFSIKIKSVIPVNTANDKNFVIAAVAKIDSPSIESPLVENKIVAGNEVDVKLSSKIILDTLGYYNDALISNSGPVPPIVGQETTYTLHWKVTNISNDLMDARVTAELPSNVTMTGNISPSDAKLVYNERTNSLVWEIGEIVAGAGITAPPKEVAFQVKLVPLPSQADVTADLLKDSTLTAKDVFTKEDLTATTFGKTTLLIEDRSLEAASRVQAAN